MNVAHGLRALLAIAGKDLRLLARDRPRLVLTGAWPLLIAIFFGLVGPSTNPYPIRVWLGGSHLAVQRWHPLLTDLLPYPVDATNPAGATRPQDVVIAVDDTQHVTIAAADPATRQHVANAIVLAEHRLDQLNRPGQPDMRSPWQLEFVQPSVSSAAPVQHGHALTFPQGIVWALISLAAKFGLEFAQEYERGTLLRLHVAPLSPLLVVLGKTLACATAMVVMVVVLLTIAHWGFAVGVAAPLALLAAMFSSVVAFCGIMAAIGVASRKTAAASNITWAALMTMAMIGGGMVPTHLLPEFAQDLAKVSPVNWAITVFEAGLWRQLEPTSLALFHFALLGIGLLGLGLGGRWLARYER